MGDRGIAAWRFRTGVALIALGGVFYVIASIESSDALFAVAIALVGVGLLVHLTDPVVYRNLLTAAALVVAIAGAFTDAALTATDHSGAGTAVATSVLVVGVLVAAASRKLGRR
jgi:hypothetical protein